VLITYWLKYLLLKRKVTGARLFILMVDRAWHSKGVSAAIYHRIFSAAQRRGYAYGEGGTVHEFNAKMVQDAMRAGGRPYKTYRIYRLDF
jgi:GNAT superfamily N-acetyltransferase